PNRRNWRRRRRGRRWWRWRCDVACGRRRSVVAIRRARDRDEVSVSMRNDLLLHEECFENGIGGLTIDVDVHIVLVHRDALRHDEAPARLGREVLQAFARLSVELEVDLL